MPLENSRFWLRIMPSIGLLLNIPTVMLRSRHANLQNVDFVLCMLVTDRKGVLGSGNLDKMAEGIRNGPENDLILNIIDVPTHQAMRLFIRR